MMPLVSPGLLPSPRRAFGRTELALGRASLARASLRSCRLCAHRCGVDRTQGPAGRCHAGPSPRIFGLHTEVANELCIGPTFAIAFSGCDLRCAFCITGKESWNPREGAELSVHSIASSARSALRNGARSVMLLGGEPTLFLAEALELAAAIPAETPVLLKTNAHQSREALRIAAGVFDLWIPDVKFGNDACARELAGIDRYSGIVRGNLEALHGSERLLVRHLLMPGHVECCWRPVAEWLASRLPGVPVSLQTGYWPAWQAGRIEGLSRSCDRREVDRAFDIAVEFGLHLVE